MTTEGPKVEFRQSPIEGTGGFACQDICAGTLVIEYTGRRITKSESNLKCSEGNHFIFHLDDQFNLDGDTPENPARLLNHSCDPNCEAEWIDGHIWIVARRAIAAGDELTFNYGYDLDDLEDHPCHCGAPGCVGFIVAAEYFPEARKRRDRLRTTS